MNSKYGDYGNDSNGSENSNSDDSDYDDLALKWKPYATFRGTLESVFGAESKYGQMFGIKFSDVELVDGVLMQRVDNDGNREDTLKLFDWDSMPVVGEATVEDAPEVHTEEYGGTTYQYELIGARMEDSENPGDTIEVDEEVVLWESGGESPSATAKSLAQLLTNAGTEVIDNRDDINSWIHIDRCEVRDDLEGRTFDVFKVVQEGDEYDFHSPVFVDTKTEEQVLVNNGNDGDTTTDETASGSGGDETEAETGDFPEPVADFVEFCDDFDLNDEEQIRDNMDSMADDEDNSLTTDQIEAVGAENIVTAITG